MCSQWPQPPVFAWLSKAAQMLFLLPEVTLRIKTHSMSRQTTRAHIQLWSGWLCCQSTHSLVLVSIVVDYLAQSEPNSVQSCILLECMWSLGPCLQWLLQGKKQYLTLPHPEAYWNFHVGTLHQILQKADLFYPQTETKKSTKTCWFHSGSQDFINLSQVSWYD